MNNHGGKRPGAGRKRIIGKVYSYKADQDIVEYLDSTSNRNGYINEAVREKMVRDGVKISKVRPNQDQK